MVVVIDNIRTISLFLEWLLLWITIEVLSFILEWLLLWITLCRKNRPEKGLFWGNPVIQEVEAKMLGPYYQKIIFLQNISSLKNQPFLSTTS